MELTVTETQFELVGMARWVHVVPSVDEAAMDDPKAMATKSPCLVTVVACTYKFPDIVTFETMLELIYCFNRKKIKSLMI